MGRRIALVAGLVLAASLAGDVGVSAEPLPPRVLQTPEPHVVPARAAHRARRQVLRGTIVATVRPNRVVAVRSRPGGPVIARLSSRTEFGSPRTFAVVHAGRGFRVITTELPNGRTGWVDGDGALRLSRSRVSVDVDLSERELRVRIGSRVARRIPVGIGAPGTATPTGRFAITDKLDGAVYSPVYGCCILALSGHQTNLPRGWTGGDRLAIHGGTTGGAVSTGCLHAADAELRYLMRVVPLGAQVSIHP